MTPETIERLTQLGQLVALLAAGVALAYGGFDILASTVLGGALGLVVPRAPKGAALALGLAAGGVAAALAPNIG